MKLLKTLALTVTLLSAIHCPALLNIPSNGSDGDLVITTSTNIDLSLAPSADWDSVSTGANIGRGRYDAAKWAVVFHYRSVTIQAGATVTFKNHSRRAPVVWLVQSNVTINGTVSLNGQTVGYNSPFLAEPPPGGFRGGMGKYSAGAAEAAGFGPGGGIIAVGGSYGSVGINGTGPTYGNAHLIPLIGGSGGAGHVSGQGGGAGGGAILIAAADNLSVAGKLSANGGAGGVAGGSGGGIRLIARAFSGIGTNECVGGTVGGNAGGLGRICIERVTNTYTGAIIPEPTLVNLTDGATPQIWVPTDGPSVRVVSINGNPAPADPLAEFGAFGADIVLPQITSATVVVETTNVETNAVVKVRATPRMNGNYQVGTAAVSQVVSNSPLVLRWTANVAVKDGYEAVQVQVVRP